ncbi:MAG: tRNA (N6-threonylcarbamoyladenosine(37)-N6)-methyltransferase TrmO [Syntrophomonas sp.]
MREEMRLKTIGIIHSLYMEPGDAPRQGRLAVETAQIEIFPEYLAGLKDIDRVSHLIVLYWCDRSDRDVLQTMTAFSPEPKGVFACRAPNRPNPIAFCVAEILERKENLLLVQGVDALEGSPLLDLKPYSSEVDSIEGVRVGWRSTDASAPGGSANE